MRGRKSSKVPLRLARAAARFADWRRTRELGTRIPKSLWASAAKLATTYGVCQTAATLKLDYYGLKRRVEAKAPEPGSRRISGQLPAFIELAGTTVTAAECVIECENAAGSKLRIHLQGGHAPDWVALSGSFWNAQR